MPIPKRFNQSPALQTPQSTEVLIPQSISWKIVTAVNRQTNEMFVFVVGRPKPDLMRLRRRMAIEAGLGTTLPTCWTN